MQCRLEQVTTVAQNGACVWRLANFTKRLMLCITSHSIWLPMDNAWHLLPAVALGNDPSWERCTRTGGARRKWGETPGTDCFKFVSRVLCLAVRKFICSGRGSSDTPGSCNSQWSKQNEAVLARCLPGASWGQVNYRHQKTATAFRKERRANVQCAPRYS